MKARSRQSLSPVGISTGFKYTDPVTQMITTKTIKTSNLELAHFVLQILDGLKDTGRKLHSIFITGFYVSVPALGLRYSYFGWLTGKTA